MQVKIAHNPRGAWAPALFALALAAAPSLAPAQVSLATVVDLAQRNSTAVRLADADVRKAQAVLAQTHDAYIPSLNFRSGLPAVPDVGFTGGIPSILDATAQSLVFSFPQKQYIAAARAALNAASLSLKDAREQVALDASTAYIELDIVNTELAAARQQEAFAGRLVEIEQERAEAGVDPLSDLLEARLTAAQLKLKRLHLETRAATLARQLAVLTGLPVGSITPDHASIPEIPVVKADDTEPTTVAIQSAQMLALSRQKTAHGNLMEEYLPQLSFSALYSRSTTILNDFNAYYKANIPINNFSSGFSIQIPFFDLGRSAKAKESAADALRATVEAEQAQRQNEIQIASLTGSLRELDTQAEIAILKQQIANEQLQSVLAQLELGNGSESGPAAQPQLTPKAEQLARIDERQRYQDALDAGFDLAKARLSLLRALGHMEDWLHELHAK
ncbi:MAG: TolC family protein [Terracidiphilus sp.]|jgi:outer membrane protein TolC